MSSPLARSSCISLVSSHDQGELYVVLKSSIVGVISTVNRKQCLQQQRAHHEAVIAEHRGKLMTIEADIATIEEADGSRIGSDHRSSKRRQV